VTAPNGNTEIRVAAAADLHVDRGNASDWRHALEPVSDDADVLLLAGDLTQTGVADEAKALADALSSVSIPVFAVLGNHDLHMNAAAELRRILERAGVCLLEGEAAMLHVGGRTLGIAGTTGFGGGFPGAEASDFGETEMKRFVARTRDMSDRLQGALESLDANVRIALLHYAPVADTLVGERLEIYPFLGSHWLGRAVDATGADLVIHGHAHLGCEAGKTPAGVAVRNVAQPVIRAPYRVFRFAA
jgi:Icc-related predicted phosphoesterase